MSPSAVRARIARLGVRAVLADEHDELVTIKGSPLTWRPSVMRPPQPAPSTPVKEMT